MNAFFALSRPCSVGQAPRFFLSVQRNAETVIFSSGISLWLSEKKRKRRSAGNLHGFYVYFLSPRPLMNFSQVHLAGAALACSRQWRQRFLTLDFLAQRVIIATPFREIQTHPAALNLDARLIYGAEARSFAICLQIPFLRLERERGYSLFEMSSSSKHSKRARIRIFMFTVAKIFTRS